MIKAETAIMLAAGEGKRMVSGVQKVMHTICGRPMLSWALRSVQKQIVNKPIIVTGFDEERVKEHFLMEASYAHQERLGSTMEALRCGVMQLKKEEGCVIVMAANLPLVSMSSIAALVGAMDGVAASRLVCMNGDGEATPIDVYCFDIGALRSCMDEDAQDVEDILDIMESRDMPTVDVCALDTEGIAVVNREDLWVCSDIMQRLINFGHMRNGVTFRDPNSAYIDAGVRIGMDTVIYPDVYLSGGTVIGERCTVYNGCRLDNVTVGSDCTLQAVVGEDAEVCCGARIGPFVRLRPGAKVGKRCKVGNFVEIKNSTIGEKTSIAHLTYVGDADVGARVNMGCGTVFVNYDGFSKHRSTVGDDVFLGCQTALVSPVRVEDRAYTAAGTVITKDVPADALAISRGRQHNIEGWAADNRERRKK